MKTRLVCIVSTHTHNKRHESHDLTMSSLWSQLSTLYCLFSLKVKYRKRKLKIQQKSSYENDFVSFFLFRRFYSLYLCISLCTSLTSFSQTFSQSINLPLSSIHYQKTEFFFIVNLSTALQHEETFLWLQTKPEKRSLVA